MPSILTLIISIALTMSGCSPNYPIIPKPSDKQEIQGVSISYILPNDSKYSQDAVYG